MSDLGTIFGQARGRVAVLMDFNHEANALLDINRAVSEAPGANKVAAWMGMTSKKVLDGKYAPNPIATIKDVMVSSADDYDTGFHQVFAGMVRSFRKTNFTVPIMGGGQITEKQGQQWISAMAQGQSNIKIVMDISLDAGKPAKAYNAAVRLLKANYVALQKGLSTGQVQLFKNGVALQQMPSQAEIAEILSRLP
jgi:hypothetical protein